MFTIGQIVVSNTTNVCSITGIEQKDFGIGPKNYLVLKPYFSTNNSTSNIFIPEDKASKTLRLLISKEEALDLIKRTNLMEKDWISEPKQRRAHFEEIFKSNDMESKCQLLVTLNLQNKFLKESKKSLSMLDKEFFEKAQKVIFEELSVVLDLPVLEIRKMMLK